jgi:hypothetical protein
MKLRSHRYDNAKLQKTECDIDFNEVHVLLNEDEFYKFNNDYTEDLDRQQYQYIDIQLSLEPNLQ